LGNETQHLRLAERDGVEKAEGTDRLDHHRPGGVLLLDEIELVLADLLGAETVRWGPEVLGKLGDTAEIAVDGLGGIVP
jgi:hypothetical protein